MISSLCCWLTLSSLLGAGTDLGFLALALFRCAFSMTPADVAPRQAQRQFAASYLRHTQAGSDEPDEAAADALLLVTHLWSYVAMIKIGLIWCEPPHP
eukprot:COSAG01_NODE_11262_length_1970_cov_15.907002_2_plen_98_part_00